jgi:penicillin G amidase
MVLGGSKVKAVFCGLFGVVFLLLGCGKSPNAVDVAVGRTAFNEVQISVRQAPAGKADWWLFRQQGYEQARDRFLSMDVARRVGQARLSEVLGEKAVSSDRRAIGVGLARGVQLKTDYLRENFPEAYVLLEGYSEGVNQFIREIPSKNPDLLKNYRQITGDHSYSPEEWKPADSVAVAQNMAFYLSSNLQEKLMMGQIAAAVSGGKDPTSTRLAGALDTRPVFNAFIMDADPSQNSWRTKQNSPRGSESVSVLPDWEKLGWSGMPQVGCLNLPYPFPECGRKASFGSNNWVTSRAFGGGDTVFLANDPHLRLTFPFNFYAGAFDSTSAGGSFRVAGYGLVGVPGVLIGHNDSIAWGFTNNPADVDDVYFEVLDETKTKIWEGKNDRGEDIYSPMEVAKSVIKVRNARGGLDEQIVESRWGKHGPVFTDHIPEVQEVLEKFAKSQPFKVSVVGTYKWTGHLMSSEYVAMLGVNRATNYTEFKTALQEFKSGAQNMVFASTSGDIGYYSHGNYPVRTYVSQAQAPFIPVIPYARHLMGQLLTSFRKPAEWEGFRTKMPELYNPSSGRIITANNDPFGHSERKALDGYNDYFGYGFSTGARAQRITDLLDANKGRVSLETIQKIQTDHNDLLLGAFVQIAREHRADLKLGSRASDLMGKLLAWNGEMKANLKEPVLADAWASSLTSVYLDVAAPEVNAQLREAIDRTSLLGRTLYNRLKDSLESPEAGKRAFGLKLLTESFELAANRVESRGLQEVPWGRMNRLHFHNPLAGVLPAPPLVSFPLERDGSWETVDVAGEGYGPNFRLIMSLQEGKPISALTAVPGGNYTMTQKDEVFGELNRWRDGRYRPMVDFLPK